MPLTLQFNQLALTNVTDPAGLWQFEGGQVSQNEKQVANYASVKRVVVKGTDQDSQNTAMVTTTIFFIGKHPPENITLQGSHDFGSGNEVGSVSAASASQAAHIGKHYSRTGASNVVQIG